MKKVIKTSPSYTPILLVLCNNNFFINYLKKITHYTLKYCLSLKIQKEFI